MSKEALLPVTIQNQLNSADVKVKFILTIGGYDYSDYVIGWTVSSNVDFGSMSATFTLNNNDNIFGDNGSDIINVGDIISFSELFEGSTKEFKKFYGQVNQRSYTKTATDRKVTLVCLDYISTLQFLDIDLEVEGDKIKVEEEILTPIFLASPNDTLAQVFNFANENIADNPLPLLTIRNKNNDVEDPQYDGYTVLYDNGQVKLGSCLNAKDNYDLVATAYYFYTRGLYAEDIIEEILTLPDGYGKYLFNEPSAQALIDNHLTTSYLTEMGSITDDLVPNYTPTEISIYHQLTQNVIGGNTIIYLDSVIGLPASGEGKINGDTFTWTSIVGNSLEGIPSTGSYALKNHVTDSYFKYTKTYPAGQVWYMTYSNIQTNLINDNFTLPSGITVKYFDKRFGRIILDNPILTTATVTCDVDYSFKTMQASGIELNQMSFRSRELDNRYEAIKKVRNYLAPNFLVRTKGDDKIWASYFSQKVNEDYTLKLATSLNFMEDEDLYTRVILYGKNKNPTNLMYNDGVTFIGTGLPYKAIATATELAHLRDEDNYYIYGNAVSGIGKITTDVIKPIVYINDVAVDNTSHIIAGQGVAIETTTTTTTTSGGGKF
jgi:hypothetical protein